MNRAVILAVIHLLTSVFAAGTYAAPATQSDGQMDRRDPSEHWGYLLAGWRAEREKLKSWNFRASGFEQSFKSWDRACSGELTDPGVRRVVDLNGVSDRAGERSRTAARWGTGFQPSGVWIRTPEYLAYWQDIPSALVEVVTPSMDRPEFVVDFDPRAVGPLGPLDFKTSYKRDSFNAIFDQLTTKLSVKSDTVMEKGRHEVVLVPKERRAGFDRQLVLVVNERNGFTVESSKLFPDAASREGKRKPLAEISVDWVKRGEIWVVSGNNYLGLAGYVTHSRVLHTRSASPAAIAGVRGRQ